MDNEPYQTLSSRRVWQSRWYSLRQDAVRFPGGQEGTYTVIERSDAVFVVPVTVEGSIVLIHNYRYTVRRWLWEVPAGSVEPGDSPLESARRELLEETGGSARSMIPVGSFYTAPGISDERSHVFLAQGVRLGLPEREPGEIMEVHLFPPRRVMEMIRLGEMLDGPSALSVLLCAPHIPADGLLG